MRSKHSINQDRNRLSKESWEQDYLPNRKSSYYKDGGEISAEDKATLDKLKKNLSNPSLAENIKPIMKRRIAEIEAKYKKDIVAPVKNEVKATEKPIAKEVAKVEKAVKKTAKKSVGNTKSALATGSKEAHKVAKEIRKDGETYNTALKRAWEVVRGEITKSEATGTTKTPKKKAVTSKKRVKASASAPKVVSKKKKVTSKKRALTDVGQTERGLKQDSKRQALPAGKRISKDGNVYYESRANRADKRKVKKGVTSKRRIKMLAKGGQAGVDYTEIDKAKERLRLAKKTNISSEIDKAAMELDKAWKKQGYAKGGQIDYETAIAKDGVKLHRKNTHFAIHKPTNSIAEAWNYKGYDKEELMESKDDYFYEDLRNIYGDDMDKFKKSDFAIVEKKNLPKYNIDLNEYSVFRGQKYK